MRVFGSVARGEDTASSDVDILVDLADGVGVVGLVGLERELSEILKRPVDVVPRSGVEAGCCQARRRRGDRPVRNDAQRLADVLAATPPAADRSAATSPPRISLTVIRYLPA